MFGIAESGRNSKTSRLVPKRPDLDAAEHCPFAQHSAVPEKV
jgi:hypothetical protein